MATERLSPDAAAALLAPVDTLGIPLGPGQPPARDDLRVRDRGGLRVARRRPGRGLPHRRGRQLAGHDRPEPPGGDGQRRAGTRHPRPGGGRHDRRRPVLRDRRPRGLRLGAGALGLRPLADLPALDGDGRGRAPLPDRAVVRRCHRRRHSAPPGRRRHHRVRRGRAPGQDGRPARRGARRDRPPGLPRGAARGRGARSHGRSPMAGG